MADPLNSSPVDHRPAVDSSRHLRDTDSSSAGLGGRCIRKMEELALAKLVDNCCFSPLRLSYLMSNRRTNIFDSFQFLVGKRQTGECWCVLHSHKYCFVCFSCWCSSSSNLYQSLDRRSIRLNNPIKGRLLRLLPMISSCMQWELFQKTIRDPPNMRPVANFRSL